MTPALQTQEKTVDHQYTFFHRQERGLSEWQDNSKRKYELESDSQSYFDWVAKGIAPSKPEYPWENYNPELAELAEEIKKSLYLIKIPDESDLNGPKPPDKETWEKGCKFLWRHAEKLLKFANKRLEKPIISATPKGGMRFYWNKPGYRMLITIHPVKNRVTYYGDNAKWKNWEERETTVDELDYKLISWFTLVL